MSKSKKSSRASRRPPLRWPHVERWLDCGRRADDWKRAHIDRRLFTIAPAFQGLLHGLRGRRDPSAAEKAEILALAKRAQGTFVGQAFRRDHVRVLAVCDWMIRCALPLWLDRLPTWCIGRDAAQRLRALTALIWTQQIVDAISVLSPVWISLGDAARDRGTAEERKAVINAHALAHEALQVVAAVLPRNLDFGSDGNDAWLCDMAMRLLRFSGNHECDPVIRRTLPALIDVLFAVQDGDSRQSIADRCVWPVPSKRRAA